MSSVRRAIRALLPTRTGARGSGWLNGDAALYGRQQAGGGSAAENGRVGQADATPGAALATTTARVVRTRCGRAVPTASTLFLRDREVNGSDPPRCQVMKRSEALTPLSRDHHRALEAALMLRRAEAGTVDQAVAHFQLFFTHQGRPHFTLEEEHLLPALPADDPEWGPLAQRVRDDHAAIRAQAEALDALEGDERIAAARALGERLNDHVRFEERVLFALLEDRLEPG